MAHLWPFRLHEGQTFGQWGKCLWTTLLYIHYIWILVKERVKRLFTVRVNNTKFRILLWNWTRVSGYSTLVQFQSGTRSFVLLTLTVIHCIFKHTQNTEKMPLSLCCAEFTLYLRVSKIRVLPYVVL